MEKLKVRGKVRKHVNLKVFSDLTGKQIRILIEKGIRLIVVLERIAVQTRDSEVIKVLKENPDLLTVLQKWKEDLQ